jgi:hypothetical protein
MRRSQRWHQAMCRCSPSPSEYTTSSSTPQPTSGGGPAPNIRRGASIRAKRVFEGCALSPVAQAKPQTDAPNRGDILRRRRLTSGSLRRAPEAARPIPTLSRQSSNWTQRKPETDAAIRERGRLHPSTASRNTAKTRRVFNAFRLKCGCASRQIRLHWPSRDGVRAPLIKAKRQAAG